VNESGSTLAVDALSQVKHVLLPVTDRNPYLSEGTRQVHQFLQNISIVYMYSYNLLQVFVKHVRYRPYRIYRQALIIVTTTCEL
jgi:hypothetical protein